MGIVGALIADGWLGNYYLYIVYVIGFVVIVLGSIQVLGMSSRYTKQLSIYHLITYHYPQRIHRNRLIADRYGHGYDGH